MEQLAKIIETDGKTAIVEASRSTMCDGCSSTDCGAECAMAGLFSSGKKMRTKANNAIGARPGDIVEVGSPTPTVLLHALLVFIMPIAVTLAAYFIARSVAQTENVALISGGIAFVLSIVAVLIAESAAKKRPPAVTVLRIVRPAAENRGEEEDG